MGFHETKLLKNKLTDFQVENYIKKCFSRNSFVWIEVVLLSSVGTNFYNFWENRELLKKVFIKYELTWDLPTVEALPVNGEF